MNKKMLLLMIAVVVVLAGCSMNTASKDVDVKLAENQFLDDMAEVITVEKPATRIISLYSAHTENLYHLGLGDRIIGVGTSDIYPSDVLTKEIFDYKSDPEKIIAAEPDLVLIRPFINRKVPEFVATLKKAGINVVSLYPERYEEFDEYIYKLAKLTDSKDVAEKKLEAFYSDIENVKEITKAIEEVRTVYFEASENGYKTVTPDSMPGLAIEYAGAKNIAMDVKPYKEGSSIAEFGIERILENSDNIDVFISQRGVMNAGGNYHSIVIRPGFDTLKCVKEDKVYVINQKLISSPTFRFAKGVKELARMVYPEIMNDVNNFKSDELVTRRDLAKIVVMSTGKQTYIPSSKYYRKKHSGHVYGMFKDIDFMDRDFDMIETAVMAGYIKSKLIDGDEYFKPDELVTRDELAQMLFVLADFKNEDYLIDDEDEIKNVKCVKTLVAHGILKLNNGKFEPEKNVSYNDLIDILDKL